MRISAPRLKAALPYLSLAVALVLCGAAFFRSEQYRAESDLNYSQTYEVQWRTTQIREHLARIHGQLRLAAAIGRMDADLGRQIFLLNANVDQLLKLEYTPKFLDERDVELLRGLQSRAGAHLDSIVQGGTNFVRALQIMPDLEQRMFEVSGTAVAHAETLNTAGRIAEAASRNRFLFAAALAIAALCYTIIHLRNDLTRKQEQHLRSFSSLYAHMTRSRVAALKLFLGYQNETNTKHPEMLVAAREAADQLALITDGLGTIGYADMNPRRERLSAIVSQISRSSAVSVKFNIGSDAAEAQVPAVALRLILDELVRNAEIALCNTPNANVQIAAGIERNIFLQQRLWISVEDNGPGMSPGSLERATIPFFSTRAGAHTGLGLTGCAQMVGVLRGTFKISSKPIQGTSVRVFIPIR